MSKSEDSVFIRRAEQIAKGIDSRLSSITSPLVVNGIPTNNKELFSFDNSTFAILEYLIGDKKRADQINRIMGTFFNFDGVLIAKGNIYSPCVITSRDNAAFGILNYILGDKKRAETILEGIESSMGFDDGLVKYFQTHSGENSCFTDSSALFGVLDYLVKGKKRAKKILNDIETKIGFNNLGFIRDSIHSYNVLTSSNASFAILDYLLGNKKRARDNISSLSVLVGFEGEFIKYAPETRGIFASPNSLYGIACALIGGKKLKN